MNDDFEVNDSVSESGISIHAGFPNPAADRQLHSLDLNQLLITHPSSTFIFRVRGDQGANYGIFDGDIAIVDRAVTPTSNDFMLWHDGRQFKLSRSTKMTDGSTVWGIVNAIVHQYRSVTK